MRLPQGCAKLLALAPGILCLAHDAGERRAADRRRGLDGARAGEVMAGCGASFDSALTRRLRMRRFSLGLSPSSSS